MQEHALSDQAETTSLAEIPDEDTDLADYSLFDESNPRSLVNIVPKEVREALRRIPRKVMLQSEGELKRAVRPSPTLNYLRLNFWLEYNRAQELRKTMNMTNVVKGVTHKDYLYQYVLIDPMMTAWVATPPTDYALVQQDILFSGLEKMRKALKIPLVTIKEKLDEEGKVVSRTKSPNVAAIAEARKITEWLADRVQGTLIQRVAIKQQTQTLGSDQSLDGGGHDASAAERLDRLLTSTEQKLAQIEAQGTVVETTAITVTEAAKPRPILQYAPESDELPDEEEL